MDAQSNYGSDIDFTSLEASSDYGSDFHPDDIDETTLIGDLLAQIAATAPRQRAHYSVQAKAEGQDDGGVVIHKSPAVVRSAQTIVQSPSGHATRCASVEVEYDHGSRHSFSLPQEQPSTECATSAPATDVVVATSNAFAVDSEKQSPLERFRTKPRKPLSVTDLVSPAWCELQYLYTLSKFGRKPRTAAMRTGSRIHRTLEEQVHSIVPVRVESKEDRFGLRLWNTIQGLRTLRETGLTRELEIWGILEGQVVNGVIDELTYSCPDPEFEERLELSRVARTGGTLPLGQSKMEDAFTNADAFIGDDNANAWVGRLEPDRRVYIADVKTRGVPSTPSGATLRPTWMQLMLYRKLLESLSLNSVDAETVLVRYGLEPLDGFTESFMLEVGALDRRQVDETAPEGRNPHHTNRSTETSHYPNLLSLWYLMISEFRTSVITISDILRAEFLYAKTGDLIGSELTTYDPDTIDLYIISEMQWWKGLRSTKGVEVEEAFKCRACNFADDCTWRKRKVEEAIERHRLRVGTRRKKSAV